MVLFVCLPFPMIDSVKEKFSFFSILDLSAQGTERSYPTLLPFEELSFAASQSTETKTANDIQNAKAF